MPKPNRGMTQTIKQRSIYVYLPSKEIVQDWKTRAERAGVSISKFVFDRVEDSVKKDEGQESYLSRLELVKSVKETQEELKRLREDNRMLKKLVENYEDELKRYRAKPFTEEGFEGVRTFDKELVELLKAGRTYSSDEILTHLNVEPAETEIVKAISKQLQILESYGLLEFTGKGWRWKA